MTPENCPPSLHQQNTTSHNRGCSCPAGYGHASPEYYAHGAIRTLPPGVCRSRPSARSFRRGAESRPLSDWFSCGLCSGHRRTPCAPTEPMVTGFIIRTLSQTRSAFRGKADIPFCTANVRYWPLADTSECSAQVRF